MTRQVRVPWRRAGPSNLVIMLADTASLRGSILRIDTLKAENTLEIAHVQINISVCDSRSVVFHLLLCPT